MSDKMPIDDVVDPKTEKELVPTEGSDADAFAESSEGKDKSKIAISKIIDSKQMPEAKKAPASFRRLSVNKPFKPDSAKSKPVLKASNPMKTEKNSPKAVPKKGAELGAIPKTTLSKSTRQSLTTPSSSKLLEKGFAGKGKGGEETGRFGKVSQIKSLPKQPKMITTKQSKTPSEINEGKGSSTSGIKRSDSKYVVKDMGVIVSSKIKTRKSFAPGTIKSLDESNQLKVKGTDGQQASESLKTLNVPSEETSEIRELCIDFIGFRKAHMNRQKALRQNWVARFIEMDAALKQGERICKIISKMSKKIPREEAELRVENDKLNYLILSSAGIFKRIDDQFEFFKQEANEYTSNIAETDIGITERLQKVLTSVCEMSVFGSEVK